MPLRGQGIENARTISGLPQLPVVQSAPHARLVVSSWDREIHIWRIGSEAQHEKPRQKVARILLKGEENISSVSISDDGTLLAVSTAAEVKMFYLVLKSLKGKSSLRIRKIETPRMVASQGARLLQFSPDGKWLAIITHENKILLTRMNKSLMLKPRYHILMTIVKLSRNKRRSEKPFSVKRASDNYLQMINRIAFSPDSSILIVSDLSGNLDSWVLEGYEDLTGPAADIVREDTSTGDSDGDEDEDDKDEKDDTVVYGQRWIHNPCGHKLPRVDSAPVVLSFRPFIPNDINQYHKDRAKDPSRNKLYTYSNQQPHGERYVFVLTAKHRMYEFGIVSGRLSYWSRNNSTKSLPPEFRRIRDRAMGCIWDIQEERQGKKRERIWLYGSSWISMFDLSHDFATTESNGVPAARGDIATNGAAKRELSMVNNKRKHNSTVEGHESRHKVQESGAGSKIPHAELRGIGKKLRKSVGPDRFAAETVWLNGVDDEALLSDDDDDDDDCNVGFNSNTNLANDNRAYVNGNLHGDDTTLANGTDEDLDHHVNGDATDDNDSGDNDDTGRKSAKWHCVYKYRPILGAVVVGGIGGLTASGEVEIGKNIRKASQKQKSINGNISEREDSNEDKESEAERGAFALPEIAIVERPLWDLDLPPRFVGTHERER